MNVMETLLFQQMQQVAASIPTLSQSGGAKDKTGGSSFQDLMDQINRDSAPAAARDGKESGETAEKPVKDAQETLETEENKPVLQEKEELRPEDLVANPNVVQYVDFFQPDAAVAAVEETVIPVPVEALPQQDLEGADMELDGQMPTLDTAVETSVQMETPMEHRESGFQETMEELPQEQTAEAPVEQADAPQRAVKTEEPRSGDEVEVVHTEDGGDEPKAEAVDASETIFHDAKAAPVKVGERYETVDTQAPDMDEQVAAAVRQAAQASTERVEIRLAPEHLGQLTIEMTRDASGALQVVLHASTSRAAGLLTEHLTGLHAALQGQAETVHVEVQRGQESQRQDLHQQADPDGRNQNHQHQERREEHTSGEAFLQKLRLGLFGSEEEV